MYSIPFPSPGYWLSHIHVYSHSGAFVIKHCLGRKIFIDNNEFPISILPLKILFTTTITTKYYSGNPPDRHSRERTALLMTTFKTDLDGAIFACDYCARLAYVMIFDYPHAHSFHLQLFHNESYECGGSNLHDMICHEVKTVVSCVTLHTFCTNIT